MCGVTTVGTDVSRYVVSSIAFFLLVSGSTIGMAEEPADYRSRNFLIHTDLPGDEAEELLKKLETMQRMISRYWGAPLRKPVECYVVKDVKNWPAATLAPQARSIVQNGGITIAQGVRRGNAFNLTATVFASSKYGTTLHEAVHAYCYHTFGETGPTWYSEGMAEMGNYWQEDDPTVAAPEYVIDFLRRSPRKTLDEITDGKDRTGDGWQNYAWRWALCHFLVNNPNYRDRFRQLGVSFLSRRSGSFKRAYSSQMRELEFEFDLFVTNLKVGINAEQTAWNWRARFRKPTQDRKVTSKIYARRGWQASGVEVEAGKTYRYVSDGTWKVTTESSTTADGSVSGPGKLVGAVFSDYSLGQVIELGAQGSFTAATSGRLVLRCRDHWNALEDNSGILTVKISCAEEKRTP